MVGIIILKIRWLLIENSVCFLLTGAYRLQGVAGTLDLIAANNDITNGMARTGEMFALLSHTVGDVYKQLWQLVDPEQEEEQC